MYTVIEINNERDNMDSLLFGMLGGIIFSIITIGLQIKWRLQSIENLLEKILEHKNNNSEKRD